MSIIHSSKQASKEHAAAPANSSSILSSTQQKQQQQQNALTHVMMCHHCYYLKWVSRMWLIMSRSWIPTKLWGLIVSLQNLFEFHLSVWLCLLQNLSTKVFHISLLLESCHCNSSFKQHFTHQFLSNIGLAGFLKAFGTSGIRPDNCSFCNHNYFVFREIISLLWPFHTRCFVTCIWFLL